MRNKIFIIIVLEVILGLVIVFADGALLTSNAGNKGFDTPSGALIPLPVKQEMGSGYFTVDSKTEVVSTCEESYEIAGYLYDFLWDRFHEEKTILPSFSSNGKITLKIAEDTGKEAEGYKIVVSKESILIEGHDREGLFYGVQTLLQLMPSEIYDMSSGFRTIKIPCQTIEDYPVLAYRGMMLDVARTFLPKEEVMKFIDRMAYHKLNKLHWHLTDDEGWRIELKSFPRFAEVGGFRGGDSPVKSIYGAWGTEYGGFYTQDEINEIVAYASFRNVEIIPEIDLPGHSRSAAKAYPQILCRGKVDSTASAYDRRNVWCAAKESNYEILDAVFSEICDLFPAEHIHIGGDEVLLGQWRGCPDCQKLMQTNKYTNAKELQDYFTGKLTEILEAKGRKVAAWDESAASGKLDNQSHVYGWQGVAQCQAALENGYETVVMPGSYFYIDMKSSPDEGGQTWAGIVDAKRIYSFGFAKTGFTANKMNKVLGVEGAFFSELLVSYTPDYLDYQTYPKMCALAEVGWTAEERREWKEFYSRLTSYHIDRLGSMNIAYRQFPPEVSYSKGVITAVAPFEGAEIRYTTDGTEPHAASLQYTQPINDTDPNKYLFSTFYLESRSPSVFPTVRSKYTIAAFQSSTFEVPLSAMGENPGLWYLRIRTTDANMKIGRIAIASPDTSYTIIRSAQRLDEAHRMRFNINKKNKEGTMSITMNNENGFDCDLVFEFQPSPYIQPAVTVTSSMKANTRFPFKNVTDYNFTSYSRTSGTCKKGDHFTFNFTNHVSAQSIEVVTGLSYLPRYHIPFGRVQTSIDGIKFTDAAQLDNGKAVIYPQDNIKALRIVSDTDGNGETAVAIQDLKIIPRK